MLNKDDSGKGLAPRPLLVSAATIVAAMLSFPGAVLGRSPEGTTTRVSVSSAGEQGNSDSTPNQLQGFGPLRPSISADGRFVAFESGASNLVSGDAPACRSTTGPINCRDVFVHDRDADGDSIFDEAGAIATAMVSVSSAGVQGNGHSGSPAISGDGRYVAFFSLADNLVPGDSNVDFDVFVHDRDVDEDGVFDEAGAVATSRVPRASAGADTVGTSVDPSVSADGRLVAFASVDLRFDGGAGLPSVRPDRWDIFVHDRQGGLTQQVTVSPEGDPGNANSAEPFLAADGGYLAFSSGASNLVPGDDNGKTDIFVRDLQAGTTVLVSRSSAGSQGDGNSFQPTLSADGRFVAFASEASNLVAGDNTIGFDTFVHDRDADGDGVFDEPGAVTTVRPAAFATQPFLSADGRYVAYQQRVPFPVRLMLVVQDRDADDDGIFDEPGAVATVQASVSSTGEEANRLSSGSAVSADGDHVAFRSFATNLVAGDTNGSVDIFVRSDPFRHLDGDGDGRLDGWDNCAAVANRDQADLDGDGIGDACDHDVDGDGVLQPPDNCPRLSNPGQGDLDADGIGDACDLENTVIIDIVGGDVRLSPNRNVTVAVLGTPSFDATTLDPDSVCFGDAENPNERDCTEAHARGHFEDVDQDGDVDLALHYEAAETGIDPGDTVACLTGTTRAGIAIEGCGEITVRQ